jgi:hypothetical protein
MLFYSRVREFAMASGEVTEAELTAFLRANQNFVHIARELSHIRCRKNHTALEV